MTPSHRSVTRLAGFFGPYDGEPVSVEQMNQDIAAEAARQALDRARAGADFAEALIVSLNQAAGCSATVTFDQATIRQAGMVDAAAAGG